MLIRGGFDLVKQDQERLLEEVKKFQAKRKASAKTLWHDGI